MKKRVAIVDYGVGNVRSIENAIRWLGYDAKTTRNEKRLKEAEFLILPGVGAFGEAVVNLVKYRLIGILNELVIEGGKPILGICLGMQLLADTSEEKGLHKGLGWISGEVKKLDLPKGCMVPHVGWNDISIRRDSPLFRRTPDAPNFYFDHSYHFVCRDPEDILATCDCGNEITVAVNKGHIWGVQFHPEKSQNNGLKLFRGTIGSILEG